MTAAYTIDRGIAGGCSWRAIEDREGDLVTFPSLREAVEASVGHSGLYRVRLGREVLWQGTDDDAAAWCVEDDAAADAQEAAVMARRGAA